MDQPIPWRLLARLTREFQRDDEAPTLTPRQRDVLRCASVGLGIRETAEVMGIAEYTVKDHRAHAIYAMRAKTLTHAVALAIRAGFIDPPPR